MKVPKHFFYASWYLKACFYLAVFGFAAMFILRIVLAHSPAADLAGMEQNVVYAIQRSLDGEKIYGEPDALPFAITQYAPLYYYVCGLSAKAAGLDPEKDVAAIYLTGRLWSLLFNVLMMWAVFMISRRLGSRFDVSAIAALCSFIFLYRHDFSIRPDSMHDALILWSVYFFIAYLMAGQRPGKFDFAAMLFAVLAIFSKQSGILLPGLILSFLFLTGDFRGFLNQSLLFILLFGGFMGLFFMMYGEPFFENVIGGVANGINVRWFVLYILAPSFFIKIFPLIVAVAALSLYRGAIFKAEPAWRFLAYSSAGAFLFAALTALKMGSSIQYFSVFQTLALVFVINFLFHPSYGPASNGLGRWLPAHRLKNIALFYFGLLIALNVLSQFYKNIDLEFTHRKERDENQSIALSAAAYVNDNLQGESARYVFLNLGEERYGMPNALFRNCVVPQLDIFQASTKPLKIFDYAYFEECMENGEIKYLVEHDPPPPFKITSRYDILKSNYRLVKEIGAYSIYEYRGRMRTAGN